MAYARRECEICHNTFQPKQRVTVKGAYTELHRCKQCRDAGEDVTANAALKAWRPGDPLPKAREHNVSNPPQVVVGREDAHELLEQTPPMSQVVFDLETWGLDRGWGVILMGSFLIHDKGGPRWEYFDIRQHPKWPEVRSDDSLLTAHMLRVLSECQIAYAHNGEDFDMKMVNSAALKFGMPRLRMKLVDPVQIFRRKFRIGSNSLDAIADFLGLPEKKMHISREVWRQALLDNNSECWDILKERNMSDVRVLNAVARAISNDVGMVDERGSAWR